MQSSTGSEWIHRRMKNMATARKKSMSSKYAVGRDKELKCTAGLASAGTQDARLPTLVLKFD
jgi:hypothetical protein